MFDMELLTIEKSLLIKLFNANYIIEERNNIIFDIKEIEKYKQDKIFCKRIDRDNKLIIIY